MNRVLLKALAPFVAALLLISCTDSSQVPQEPGSTKVRLLVLEQFDMAATGWGIVLPVRFEGKVYEFVLDTGASFNAFDEVFRPYLGASVGTKKALLVGDKAPRVVELFAAPDAYLGNLSLKTAEPVVCLDFSTLRRLSGRKVAGLIGMSFLKDYFVDIDFDMRLVEFCRKVDESDRIIPNPPRSEGSQPIPPEVLVTLPTGPELFMLDTGDSDVGAIAGATFDKLVEGGWMALVGTATSGSPKGRHRWVTGRLRTFTFQNVEHGDLVFKRSKPSRLGFRVLSRYNIRCDFPHGRMHLTARTQPEDNARSARPGRR